MYCETTSSFYSWPVDYFLGNKPTVSTMTWSSTKIAKRVAGSVKTCATLDAIFSSNLI